jgi:hypothetical protein
MRGGFIDGVTRLLMLVLAITTSLAILGAIAAMSEGGGGGGFPLDPRPATMAERDSVEAEPPADAAGIRRSRTPAPEGQIVGAAETPIPAEHRSESWLEAIAYILVAIAALLAIAALILWRAFAQLRRIADSLERR